jgi:hypothetical protein
MFPHEKRNRKTPSLLKGLERKKERIYNNNNNDNDNKLKFKGLKILI